MFYQTKAKTSNDAVQIDSVGETDCVRKPSLDTRHILIISGRSSSSLPRSTKPISHNILSATLVSPLSTASSDHRFHFRVPRLPCRLRSFSYIDLTAFRSPPSHETCPKSVSTYSLAIHLYYPSIPFFVPSTFSSPPRTFSAARHSKLNNKVGLAMRSIKHSFQSRSKYSYRIERNALDIFFQSLTCRKTTNYKTNVLQTWAISLNGYITLMRSLELKPLQSKR